jgi:glc operon protein GlcG
MTRLETTLGYTDACIAAGAISDALSQDGRSAVVAVCDSHGELILLARLDGAPLPSILIAANKGWTAARERKASRAVGDAARDPVNGFDIGYYGDARYTGWGGGVPIVLCNQVVGSVAVSGLAEELDMKYAQIGADAVVNRGSHQASDKKSRD